MCQWMTGLNKRSKNGSSKKKNLVLSIKPCADEKTFYRFRLLGFGGTSGRDDPFIERFVHQHWGINKEKGYPVLEDEIVCPVTPHVHVEGDKYKACKVCDIANKYFITFKESNWKDKDASKKNKEFGRKYQAIIPVYVVSDPNYDGNNNKFKVLIFNDKKFYKEFRSKVEKALMKNQVFNGSNAVDCCIHMSEVSEKVNEGTPNERIWKRKVIDKVVFSNKPNDIPAITKEMCDQMAFDDTYYVSSTPEEIDAFYKKYCTISNDDIPMDDEVKPSDAHVEATPAATSVANEEAAKPSDDISESDLDDLTSGGMPFDEPAKTEALAKKVESDDVDAESLLEELDI